MLRRAKQTAKKHLQLAGYARWFRASMALVVLISLCIPSLSWISDIKAYALSPEVQKVIGPVNENLSAKFSFDAANNRWQFNKDGVAVLANDIAKQQGSSEAEGVAGALSQLATKQIGGSGAQDTSLYSVDLPVNAKEGITYFDNVTRLSFKMVPNFAARGGKMVDGRVVYPFSDGGLIVYTAKSNGLKEDIVLEKYLGDELSYSYTLNLPETLEARLLDDGSVGIYSANLALFGNISFSNDEDKAKVIEARKNGTKDNLIFGIPAPFIKDQNGEAGHTRYELDGNTLTVVAEGLEGLNYPLTVDPSVTVTSSTDFETGNNEGMIDFDTTGQITRGSLTGGSLNSGWVNATGTLPAALTGFRAVAVLNGKVYALNEENQNLYYATITNGTLSSWSTATANVGFNSGYTLVAYNDYLYEFGAVSGTGPSRSAVHAEYYAKPTSGGDVTTWTSLQATSPWGPRGHVAAAAYDGYMYLQGGCTVYGGGFSNGNCNAGATDTWSAPINANGTLGTWVQQTGATPSAAMTSLRYRQTMVAHNGYLYIAGGCLITNDAFKNCDNHSTDVSYAKIGSSGSVGVWQSTSAMITGRTTTLITYNGYMYIIGGCKGQNCTYAAGVAPEYAQINANGSLGSWTATSTTSTGGPAERSNQIVFAHKGYIFQAGGCSAAGSPCPTQRSDSISAQIDRAGVIESYSTETDTIETDGLMHSATVAYNGFLYMLGGANGTSLSSTVTTVYYTALNSDGSTGAWSTTSSFNAQRAGAAAVAYNGYMYLLGGHHTTSDTSCSPAAGLYCSDVQKAVINSNGTLGAWSSAGGDYSTTGRGYLGAAAYNGYLYAFGGVYNNNTSVSAETSVGQIQSDGNVTGWTTTGNLETAISNFTAVQYGPYVFTLGGRPSNAYTNGVQYAVLNSTGTVTWASTTAFTNARYSPTAGVHNGYVYIAGGEFGSGTNNYSDTQYARICQTTAAIDGCNGTIGTLGTWRSTKSFTTARGGSMGTIYGGYIYVMGGCTNWGIFGACSSSAALLNDLQYARINNGGNGATGTWSNKGSFTTARAQAAAATYNGYIYLTGGCTALSTSATGCSTLTNDTRYAQVASDGSLTWASLNSNFPTSRYGHANVAYNGYLYVIGGCSAAGGTNGFCSSFLSDVQYIELNGDGNTTGNSWASAGDPLITARYGVAATAYNGYMYVTGGCSSGLIGACNSTHQTVEYAQINSDGSLGDWTSTGGSGFTTARLLHSSVAYAGKLYVAGGCSAMSLANCSTMLNDVQYATINSNGTVSSTWNSAGYFAVPRYGATLMAQNGRMYVAGGCSGTTSSCGAFQTDIQTASIGASGNLGSWGKMLGTSYTDPRYLHAGVIANGYLYLLGGVKTGPSLLADSMGTSLQLIPRTGRYSKLVTVNPTTDIAGVYYNGSLAEGSSVEYKVAPSSGVFGSVTSATQGTGSEPTPLCGTGTIYYVQVMISVSDALNNAVFADYNTSNVTDVTIYYRINATPPPDLRLNGGKWFYSNMQQPLDICKS